MGNHFSLAKGVTARKESFGLLFYRAQDTNLTFIESGELLQPEDFLLDPGIIDLFQRCQNDDEEKKVQRAVDNLLKRGLLLETQ